MKSLMRVMCFLSFREPAERSLLLTLLLCSCSIHAQAQNIEGQVVASQYGEWKVPSIGIGFSFDPASCQLSAGGKNFAAFSNGTPIKVVDENPNLTEVSNATVYAHVDSSSCSVSLGGLSYGHTSFYLTSGTGGLQEALTSGIQGTGGPNTIILNAEWYALVAPSNPAAVIASVHGSTKLGLVDVTTTPYTSYSWNGTQYIVGTITGATIPATGLVLKGAGTLGVSTPATPGTDYVIPSGSITGTASNLSGTPTLPNGTSATTQAPGDDTAALATDAFVLANQGGPPTGAAGGALTGTYPSPTIVGTAIQPKIINGVSYSALYTAFTDIGQRINACVTDAETKTNGNTTGICSVEGEAGLAAGVTLHYPIVVGDTSGDPVTLKLPAQCAFNAFGGNFTGSVASTLVTQYSNTRIISPGSIGRCVFINETAVNGAVYALYLNQSSTSNTAGTYAQMEGISFTNGTFSVPVTTASGHDAIFQFLTDNSSFKNMAIVDFETGQIPIQVGNNAGSTSSVGSPCCATAFENINVNGEYATSGILQITANSTNNATELVTFRDISIDHPAPGSPIFTCTDTSGGHGVHVAFDHLYSEFEWNNSGQVVPEFVDGTASTANACGQINVYDQEAKNEGSYTAPTASPIWQLNGTNAGSFNLLGFTMPFNVTQPVEVVQNNMSGTAGFATATSDTNGLFGLYSTETAWTPALTAGSVNVNGSVTTTSGQYLASNLATNTLLKGGENGSSSSALGSAIVQGGANGGTGGGGNAELEAGFASGGGQQGFAYTAQAFTAASSLAAVQDVVSITTTGDQIVDAPLGSTRVVGCAQTSASGTLYVVASGKYTCRFDAAPTIGDFACAPPASTGTVGQAHDNGTTACPAGQALGVVTGQVSGNLATVMIAPALGVGGGSGGAVSSVANSDGTLTISPATGSVVASLALGHVNTWTATQTFSGIIDSGITTSPSTSPICPNGAGGLFTTSGCNTGSPQWSSLVSPTGALSLSMQAYQSTFTFNAATGTSDLFALTDTASNTGTGIMTHFHTASGSTEIPWQADANGVGWRVTTSGGLASTDTVNNASQAFGTGSGGDSTCPTPAAGTSYLCTKSSGISASINGAAYAPLGVILASGTATLSSGTVTVSNANACAAGTGCIYTLTNCGKNSSTGIGTLSLGTVSAGTSFVINSLGPAASVLTTDASTVCWEIN